MTNHSVPLWKIRPLPLLGGSLASSSTIGKSLPFVHGKKERLRMFLHSWEPQIIQSIVLNVVEQVHHLIR